MRRTAKNSVHLYDSEVAHSIPWVQYYARDQYVVYIVLKLRSFNIRKKDMYTTSENFIQTKVRLQNMHRS